VAGISESQECHHVCLRVLHLPAPGLPQYGGVIMLLKHIKDARLGYYIPDHHRYFFYL